MTEHYDQLLTQCKEAIFYLLESRRPDSVAARNALTQSLTLLDQLDNTVRNSSPQLLAVSAALDTLDAATRDPACSQLLTCILELKPHLEWRQNPTYASAKVPAQFLNNYGYVELIGPQGMILTTSCSAGILLLGSNTRYPEHAHQAKELYIPLSGLAQWKQGAQDFTARDIGSCIIHESGVSHAMQTGAEPMLALYFWYDHLEHPARLS